MFQPTAGRRVSSLSGSRSHAPCPLPPCQASGAAQRLLTRCGFNLRFELNRGRYGSFKGDKDSNNLLPEALKEET